MDILNEKIEGLVKKAEKSKMPYGILKKVYDRGMAAWKTGHRPGTTPQQWAFARVNSFITKSSGTWGKADKDLAKQVRGEEVERRKTANEMLGQVKEKLPKDADAGDYVKDFRKSDAPQFKGKSDKKKQKMAIAAYLDSKEEVQQERMNLMPPRGSNPAFNTTYVAHTQDKKVIDFLFDQENFGPKRYLKVLDYDKNRKIVFFGKGGKEIADHLKKKYRIKVTTEEVDRVEFKEENCPKCDDDPCKCENIQESGHTDVASMKTQVQIAKDALEKMNMELGKLGDEEDLPTWWTNKVATAVGKLDGMADYINAKSQQGDNMNEASRQLKDPKKETMVMKVKDAGSIMVIDKKDLKKYTSKGYIQVESNEVNLEEGKMKELHGYIAKGMSAQQIAKKMNVDVKTIEALMKEEVELDEKEIRHDGKGPIKMSKREYDKINKFRKGDIRGKPHVMATIKKGGFDYNMLVPVIFEEVDDITEETVFVIRFEKEGMRFATPFRRMQDAKDGEKILKKSAGVSNVSITKDILKPGIKFVRGKNSKRGKLI